MLKTIIETLNKEGITRIGTININECDIINPRIFPKDTKCAIIFCIPYRSNNDLIADGFSEYARTYDYHRFCAELYERTINNLNGTSKYFFKGFCDHSPINEKLAAAKCGLGVIGRNSLFIDDVYGSFVFIGSIMTNYQTDSTSYPIRYCDNCGKCANECPANAIKNHDIDRSICLSAISQKKLKTEAEKLILKNHNVVWGCDKCQLVCPHNANSKIAPLPYFKNSRLSYIDKDFIEKLSDVEFKKYAFSYKGRKIVLDNIDFI